jgi:hypothetical protein
VRLSAGHRQWVYWTAAALFASGALWLVFHYFLQVEGQFGPAPHPLEQWWLRMHGAAAMLALVVVGSLLPIHLRRGWHQRRNLPLGIMLSSVLLLLTLTGYALYYVGSEDARPWIGVLHWGIGMLAPFALVWHIARGRTAARPVQPVPAHAGETDVRTEARGLGDQTARS